MKIVGSQVLHRYLLKRDPLWQSPMRVLLSALSINRRCNYVSIKNLRILYSRVWVNHICCYSLITV